MVSFLLRRLLRGSLTVWFVLTIVFVASRSTGDPVHYLLPDNATPLQREELAARLGLDQPLPRQYLTYLANASRGEFGLSFREQRPVSEAFAERIPATLRLAGTALLLSLLLGAPAGILAAVSKDGLLDRVLMSLAFIGQALPNFVLGIGLIIVFSLFLSWFPSSGQGGWHALVLPVLTLAASSAAGIARLTRAGMIEALIQDYARTARSKGLREVTVIVKHIFRNSAVAVLTIVGLQLGALIGGSVIVESVFAWPGVGRLIVTSVSSRDFPMVQFAVILVSAGVVIANSLVDVLYLVVDPRIRTS